MHFCCHLVCIVIWRFLSSCLPVLLELSSLTSSTSPHTLLAILILPRVMCTNLVWLVHCILSFTVHEHATLRRIQNLNGLFVIIIIYFYHSQSTCMQCSNIYKTWMACPSYFIIHNPNTRDAPTNIDYWQVWGLLRLAPITFIVLICVLSLQIIWYMHICTYILWCYSLRLLLYRKGDLDELSKHGSLHQYLLHLHQNGHQPIATFW